MRAWKAAAALLAALAGTLLWPAGWADRGLRPDFLLVFAVGAGLLGGARAGCVAGVAAGLLAAPLTLDPFGLDAALLGLSGIAAAKAGSCLRAGHPAVTSGLAAACALLCGLLRLCLIAISGDGGFSLGMLACVFLGAAATAAAAPFVIFLLDALDLFRERKPEGRLTLV